MPEQVEDVAIVIDGGRWPAWESFEITLSLDSFASCSFTAPWESERSAFRATFQPFSFKPLDVLVGGARLFTGTLVGVDPKVEPGSSTLQASGYSLPAVLQDVTLPASSFPLELNGLTLRQVAQKLVEPWGLAVQMDAPDGAPFRRVAIKPDEGVYSFLVHLAQQRGLVIADTPDGGLRFLQSSGGGRPVARLREGEHPLTGVSSSFSPQSYFSEITAIAKTRVGRGGAKYTVQNPNLGALRPYTFTLDDTDGPDAPAAARAKLGRMFGNALAVQVELPTWRTPDGELWSPNMTTMLEAPGAMIFRQTEFLIRTVTLRQDAGAQSATLDMVLPGAFSGEVPEVLPWQA